MGKCYSKVNQGQRIKNDMYQTPYSMTRHLLDKEPLYHYCHVLEPASGDGAIVKILSQYFKNIDYYDKYLSDCNFKKSFFLETKQYSYIITNPPYSLANQFVIHAKKLYTRKIAFLLKLDFLSGQKRYDSGIYNELKNVYVFTRMPMLTNEIRTDGKYKTGMQTYAWFVWKKDWIQPPQIMWIDCSHDILRSK